MSATNSIRSSRNSTAVKAGDVGFRDLFYGNADEALKGFVGRVERCDVSSSASVTVSLLTASEGQGPDAVIGNTAVIEVYLSAVDPTDSSVFPLESNSTPGGGLQPTGAQLTTYFTNAVSADVPTATYQTATAKLAQLRATAVVQCTQTFIVVRIKPTASALTHLYARVETFLFPSVLSAPSTAHDGATATLQASGNTTLASADTTLTEISSKLHQGLQPNTASIAVCNSTFDELAGTINSSKVDVNIASGGFTGAVTNAGTFATQSALLANTIPDGSGTNHHVVCDANGYAAVKCMGFNTATNAQHQAQIDSTGRLQVDAVIEGLASESTLSDTSIAAGSWCSDN